MPQSDLEAEMYYSCIEATKDVMQRILYEFALMIVCNFPIVNGKGAQQPTFTDSHLSDSEEE